MHLLTYLFTYPLIKFISILPFGIVYKVSDILSFLLHKVFKYRLKTVKKNLSLAFPNKSNSEIESIEKKFYNHFADISIESIKAYGMSEAQMKNRYRYDNIEELEKIQEKNKNIILICGHYSNFEWLLSVGYSAKGNGYGIYTPMSNKYFDRLFKKIRKKHKAFLVSRYHINDFMNNLDVNKYHVFGFAADQSPRKVGKYYINNFLGHKVPIFTGAERFSKDYNLSVVFADITRIKRGFYNTKFIEILNKDNTQYGITDQFLSLLEKQIYRDPSQYFWTHNRFKHLIT
ncbi:MAG: lipid A biosynthesis acyltransferase [Cryomorphaceae bacterium]|nr:lipid A biosynthesis acyltransferase [Cryomorphaceae bacterium]MBT6546926.1 lipid A biosynthesis acyltransferase [Cryomorphaceae bacterium]MBT7546428.1 lipid A biosynthesis acyltransferase [Cryomorphaceae bacterium]